MLTSHPNLRKIPGRPMIGSHPTLSITMSGVDESVKNDLRIYGVSFVDPFGQVVEHHEKTHDLMFEDNFVIQTAYKETGLTSSPFYVRLEGSDPTGNTFWRILPTLISPASTRVEVTASSSQLECNPGNSTSAQFVVTNFGLPTDVTVGVIDDKGYFISLSDEQVSLAQNESVV